MKQSYFYILFFLLVGNIYAQEKSLFDQATQHYADHNYQAAIKNYENILDQNKISTALYFNLANSYYKLDSIGPSIYYYNKALQLSPHDEDVKNNLLFAKERTIDVIEPTPKTGWTKFIDNLIFTFSFNSWASLAIVFSIVFMIFGIWYYFTPKTNRKRVFFSVSALAFVLGSLSVVFAYRQFDQQQNKKYAVVFVQEAGVHSEPNINSTKTFTLHEGTKVKVLDNFNGYAKIRLADGKQGWIEVQAVKNL